MKILLKILAVVAYVSFYFWLPSNEARLGLIILSASILILWMLVMMGADVIYRLRHGKKAPSA